MQDDLAPLRTAVAELSWRFAKTMPEDPHYYIVRTPANEATYAALFRAVKDYGTTGVYVSRKDGRRFQQQYLHLGDGWKYWVMCDRLADSRIINRAVDDDDAPHAA